MEIENQGRYSGLLYPLHTVIGMDGFWKVPHTWGTKPSFAQITHIEGIGRAILCKIEKDHLLIKTSDLEHNIVIHFLIGDLAPSEEVESEKLPSI